MTHEEALDAFRSRWCHAPLDADDVRERVALRLTDADIGTKVIVSACPPAVRIFVRLPERSSDGRAKYTSAYVHTTAEVDGVLEELLGRAQRRAA